MLHAIFDPLTNMLGAVPFAAARWLTLGFLVSALVGVFLLKPDYIFKGASGRHWWLDLRLWALVIMIPYLLIYLLF